MKRLLTPVPLVVAFALASIACTAARPDSRPRSLDAQFVTTPPEIVDAMLKIAGVSQKDVVYDLGCGDGRIVIAAARDYGARGVGIDIDWERIADARENAKKAGVANRVVFREENLFEANIQEATVVTLFLLPRLNLKLRPKLLTDLKPGTRIVSHAFDMGDWKPLQTLVIPLAVVARARIPEANLDIPEGMDWEPERMLEVEGRRVHLWTVPERAEP